MRFCGVGPMTPIKIARDTSLKTALKQDGILADSVAGHLLFEPWSVETGQGSYYQVYSPFWKAVKNRDIAAPLPRPAEIPAPKAWPASETIADWALSKPMDRGASIVAPALCIGEDAARERLDSFIGGGIAKYKENRDIPGVAGTSRLSENLAWGEISPRMAWHAGYRAMQEGQAGAETFLKELVWREFAYHLIWHTPHITSENWRSKWDSFPWRQDRAHPEIQAWMQGRTGIRFVDAAMRELYTTGYMHNRARMIVASYLTKHLMTDWRIGLAWFEDCLVDWDPASNAMGWQWAAGSGPDAAPYFRVFNPVSQLEKFDKQHVYASRWIAEGAQSPQQSALEYFRAVPRSWGLSAVAAYPTPIVTAEAGRARALDAYQKRDF